MKRAYVIATMEPDDRLCLTVKSIDIRRNPIPTPLLSELSFEWFSATGWDDLTAHENAVGTIAFYIMCRPFMKDTILKACSPALFFEVVTSLEKQR